MRWKIATNINYVYVVNLYLHSELIFSMHVWSCGGSENLESKCNLILSSSSTGDAIQFTHSQTQMHIHQSNGMLYMNV